MKLLNFCAKGALILGASATEQAGIQIATLDAVKAAVREVVEPLRKELSELRKRFASREHDNVSYAAGDGAGLNLAEVAERLGICESTVINHRNDADFPFKVQKIGKSTRYLPFQAFQSTRSRGRDKKEA